MEKICGNCYYFENQNSKREKGICSKHSNFNMVKNKIVEIIHTTNTSNTCKDYKQAKSCNTCFWLKIQDTRNCICRNVNSGNYKKKIANNKTETFHCESWEEVHF